MRSGGTVLGVAWAASCLVGCSSPASPPAAVCPDSSACDAGAISEGGVPEGGPSADVASPADATHGEGGTGADGGGSDAHTGDSSTADGAVADGAVAAIGYLRLANWSPDAPAVDFCLAPHGSSGFTGPVVAAVGVETDASTSGLLCTQPAAGASSAVSAYVPVSTGKYDVRVVVAGGSCAAGVVPDFTSLPAVAGNTFSTIAIVGEEAPTGGDPGLQLVSFVDDDSSNGMVALRFINAAPAMQAGADLSVPTSPAFVFHGVPFGSASKAADVRLAKPDSGAPPAIDANGYAGTAVSDVALTAQPSSAAGAVVIPPVTSMGFSAATGSVITIVLVGGTSALSPPARLLECADNAGTAGPLGDCQILP